MTDGFRALALKNCLMVGASLGCLAAPGVAVAQDAEVADSERSLTAITVIARKSEESLQDVPVTVTAIGGDTLDKFQVDQVADIVSRVPALNVQVGGSGSGGQLSLRGVGSSNISAAFDSAVAFDFDGVQVSTMRMVQAGFVDLDQIDVLKGPQSLFFGKSASAGVLSMRSANPTAEWESGAKASYEFEEEGYVFGGYISGPLTDTLGIRVAAQINDIAKHVEIQPGTPADLQERGLEDLVTRLTLQWDPTPQFTTNLKFNYVRNENDGAVQHSDIDCGPNGRADEIVLLSGAIAVPANYDCDSDDNLIGTSDPSPTLVGRFPDGSAGADGRYPGRPFGETEIFFTRLAADYDLTDDFTISSVTGFINMDAVDFDSYSYGGVGPAFNPGGVPVAAIAPALAAVNTPGSAAGFGSSDPRNRFDQLTQELRIASDFDGKFNFMLGAFYEERNIDFDTSQQAVNISIIAPDPITGNTFDWYKKQHTETEALSFFGSLTYDITDRLQFAGGVRYTEEDKTAEISVPFLHTFLAGPGFVPSGFVADPIEFSDDNTSPEVSLRYQATDDVNIYAAYKTGFKSGGIDNSALPSAGLLGLNDPDPAVAAAVAEGLTFDSETGEGGEIGVKAQFYDQTLTVNSSIFYYVFDDLQVQNFDATAIQFSTFNASQLTSQGLDVDFAWNTPVDGLNLTGAFAYTDAEFTAEFITASGEDLNGREAARAPEFSGNVAFDYVRPLTQGLELGLNGNIQYTGEYITNEDTINDDIVQDDYVTLDGAISIGSREGNWTISLIGTNLTDEIWINTSGGRPFLAGPGLGLPVGDDQVVTQNRGRQIFLEARVRY